MLPRFRHILVPLDFTPKNRSALDIAFELSVENKAAVTLLHVIETIDYVEDSEVRGFYDRLQKRADAELEARAQRFAEAGLKVDWKIRYGNRAREVVDYAGEHHVDLIVMSSHAVEEGEPPRRWGTLSYQVSLLCQCPVLLVK